MRTPLILIVFVLLFASCSKSSTSDNGGSTPIDNGPLGGSYQYAGATLKYLDTIPGSGILTTFEYTTETTGHKGTLNITSNKITSTGLEFSFTTTGTRKEVNTNTGATVNSTLSPLTGSSGTSTANFTSNYSFSVPGTEMMIDDAQYLFSPSFIILPANKKYTYTFANNILTVTVEAYTASSRTRSVCTSKFQKK